MIFDVMIREGHNADGKQIVKVLRVHDSELSKYLRHVQDEEYYIVSVRPLFRNRKAEEVKTAEVPYEDTTE